MLKGKCQYDDKSEHFFKKDIFLILLIYIPIAMGLFTRGVALQDIMEEFQIDSVEAGELFSTLVVAAMIFSFLGGYLQSRLGRKNVMNLGGLIFSLSYILIGISWNFPSLFIFYTLAGVGYGIFASSFYAVLGEMGVRIKGLALGLGTGIYCVGGFLGPLASGFLIKMNGWRTPHVLWGIASFFLLFIEYVALKGQECQVRHHPSAKVSSKSSKLKDFKMLPVYAAMFFAGFSFGVFVSWAPTLFRTFHGLDVVEAGAVFGTFSIGGALGAPLLGKLSDIIGRKKLIVLEAFVSGTLAFCICSFTLNCRRLIVLSLLFGFFFHPFYSLLISFAQDIASPQDISVVTGTTMSVNYFGSFISPVIVGALLNRINLPSAMLLCGSLPVFLFGLVILICKNRSTESLKRQATTRAHNQPGCF